MTSFPRSPFLLKGAIIGLDPANPLASIIIFQYNPEEMTRSLVPNFGEPKANRAAPLRLYGPPVETISINIKISAINQLEENSTMAQAVGIYPQLSALEMLVYPKTLTVLKNAALAKTGTLQVIPPKAPLTLFIWGVQRVLPVRIESYNIQEKYYDPLLNPIAAEVGLEMRVLSYKDFNIKDPGYSIFLANQVVKEAMATLGSIGNVASLFT